MKQKSIQTISKCWTSENDRENRPRESNDFDMGTTKIINANGTEISVLLQGNENGYICLTDMARYKDKQRTDYIIPNWLRSRSTIEYLGVWEQLHNPNFNPIEFDGFRNQEGLHSFSLTPKEWV